jgi:hypothetical protein
MKGLADSLRDLGEPVADRTLVLNLLCGLSPRYDHLKALIKRTMPFPTFSAVHNELLLEELTMTIEASTPARHSTAPPLVPRRLPEDRPPARPPTAAPLAPRQHSTTDGDRRPRKGGRGGGGSSRGSSTGRGGGQGWPSFYNPWTDIISMWPSQAPSASCPPAPTPALLTTPPYGTPPSPTYGIPPYDMTTPTPAPPQLQPTGSSPTTTWPSFAGGWDPAALATAYRTMALAPLPSDWVIDS